MGCVVSGKPRLFYLWETDPVPTAEETVWAQGPVWTGHENLFPTDNRDPDLRVRSKSLYRLSYLGHKLNGGGLNPCKRRIKSHLPFASITRRCKYNSR